MWTVEVIVLLIFIFKVHGDNVWSSTASVPNNSTEGCVKVPIDHIEECTKESKVNRNYIAKMKVGYWSHPEITTSLKYWAFCYLKRLNMMTEAGVLRQDVVLKQVKIEERPRVIKIIDKCLFDKPHLPMDTAWHYLYCFHKSSYKLCKRIHGI